jgi:hypothetical protein
VEERAGERRLLSNFTAKISSEQFQLFWTQETRAV